MAPAEASDQGPAPASADREATLNEEAGAGGHDQGPAAGGGPAEEHIVVGGDELNAWRRGFTPQAEIWNGRLAMLGLSLGIAALLLIRLITTP